MACRRYGRYRRRIYVKARSRRTPKVEKRQVISIKDNRRVKVRYIEPPFNKPKWDENIDMTLRKAEATDSCLRDTYTIFRFAVDEQVGAV